MSLPDPISRYVAGTASLYEAVRELRNDVPDGSFNFSPADVSPSDLVKVMEFMRAYAVAASPETASEAATLDPKEMARIADHMRKYGRPPDS